MNDKMIFLHIPKSGGRTLHKILERFYPEERTFTIQATKTRANNTQDLRDMSPERRANIDLLKGHLSYGIHKLMGSNPNYITFLRDPRERVVSFYYYILMRKKHRLHHKIKSENLSLLDFVTTVKRKDLNNCQTRFISGIDDDEDVMLAKAIENIEKAFPFVGLTEKYDESLVVLQHLYGWPTPYYSIENKTKSRPTLDQIDFETIEVIDELNRGDRLLYNYIDNKLLNKIANVPQFESKLAELRRANSFRSNRFVQFVNRRLK